MSTSTTNLGLTKPASTEYYDIGVFNTNFDLIDEALATVDSVVTLPAALLIETPVNPSAALETFLLTCANKKVIFPRNKTYTLERQLVLNGIDNIDIDCNGCKFTIANTAVWSTRSVGGFTIGATTMFAVFDVENFTIRNLDIDGNRAGQAVDKPWSGLWLFNSKNFVSQGCNYHDCNYHNITLGTLGTYMTDIKFYDTRLGDHGGYTATTGNCEVYIQGADDDSILFSNVIIDTTTAGVSTEDQGFYHYGGHLLIENLFSRNNRTPLDARKGYMTVNNYHCIDAENAAIAQAVEAQTEFANVKITNMVATGLVGSSTANAGIYILACESFYLENAHLEFDGTSSTADYGIWIRPMYSGDVVSNIKMCNVEIINPTDVGVYYSHSVTSTTLADSSYIKNVKIKGYTTGCYGFKCGSLISAEQVVDQFELTNCNASRCYNDSYAEYIRFANSFVAVPATAGATGWKGDYSYDSGYYYYCYGHNTWGRITKASW